jgi:hypothetical protein
MRSRLLVLLLLGVALPALTLIQPVYADTKAARVHVRVTVDPSYGTVLEEVVIDLPEGEAPNLWTDMAARLSFAKWELNAKMARALNQSIQRLSGGRQRVIRTELLTSRVANYLKLNGSVDRLVLRVWYRGAVQEGWPAPSTLSLLFRRIDLSRVLGEVGGLRLKLPDRSRPLTGWELTSTPSDTVLPPAFQVPTLRLTAPRFEMEVVLPSDTVIAYPLRESVLYYRVSDIALLVTLLLLAGLVAVGVAKRPWQGRAGEDA